MHKFNNNRTPALDKLPKQEFIHPIMIDSTWRAIEEAMDIVALSEEDPINMDKVGSISQDRFMEVIIIKVNIMAITIE